jgi:hypothetical protein
LLFPIVNPAVDGEECGKDCANCTIRYPSKFSIDEDGELYGRVKGWSAHLLVATGKSDRVRDVADETGSIMEALEKSSVKPKNGVCTVPNDYNTSKISLISFLLFVGNY